MVITDLTEDLIADGAKLIERLDQKGIDVPEALWVRFPDIEAWKLTLSLPLVSREGPKQGYQVIQRALRDIKEQLGPLRLDDVAVLNPEAPLIALLRIALQTGRGISRIHFTGNTINGQVFPDALVYRVAEKGAS